MALKESVMVAHTNVFRMHAHLEETESSRKLKARHVYPQDRCVYATNVILPLSTDITVAGLKDRVTSVDDTEKDSRR